MSAIVKDFQTELLNIAKNKYHNNTVLIQRDGEAGDPCVATWQVIIPAIGEIFSFSRKKIMALRYSVGQGAGYPSPWLVRV